MFVDPTGLCYEPVYSTSTGIQTGVSWSIKTAVPGVPNFCHSCMAYKPNTKSVSPPPPPPIPTVVDSNGNIWYIETPDNTLTKDNIIKDKRTSEDPNIQIVNSYKFEPDDVLLQALLDYNSANPVDPAWNRTLESMRYEWDYHNSWYEWGIQRERSMHVDLNNADEGKSAFLKAWEGIFG